MPDSLNDIVVLPKMNKPPERSRSFRVRWVLDLVSDSNKSYINLVFKNTTTNFILVDSIPPELLSYCTIGSHFASGKLMSRHYGSKHTFTIKSTANNKFVEASKAFTDQELDLSLNGHNQFYSNICRQQLCFVQQDGPVKIVIPCFVIAATYYFKSTSLREAILSRRLDSLFHSCTIDNTTQHATIHLKPGGNIGDAYDIARMKLSPFANQRLNICKNHLKTNQSSTYQRLKVDFPVEQELTITAGGRMVDHNDGSKTFIVFNIMSEDSQYPFKSIDIYYEKGESELSSKTGGEGTFPMPRKGNTRSMTVKQPAQGYVRHLLESSKPAENPHRKSIKEKRFPNKKPKLDEQKILGVIFDDEKKDLSTQPPAAGDQSASKAEVREKEDSEKKPKAESQIDTFIQMVEQLQWETHIIEVAGKAVEVKIESFEKSESLVPRRTKGGKYVTLRESYDNTATNLRRCVYVAFTCMGYYVCLVEIDQTKAKNIGCSTRVLVSEGKIDRSLEKACVQDYVDEKLLADRKKLLADVGVLLRTLNHPPDATDEETKLWRDRLVKRICL